MKKNILKNIPCLLIILCIWLLTLAFIPTVFQSKVTPILNQVIINDTYQEAIRLEPNDILTQSFLITQDSLDTIGLAFTYDDAVLEKANLIVSFYLNEELVVEQPLPIFACPKNQFLTFSLGLSNCNGQELKVIIQNTSKTSDGIFSVMTTTDFYKYQDYTEGCALNETHHSESLLCILTGQTGNEYYKSFTEVFKLVILAMILTRIIWLGWTWLQQRNNH